MLYIFIQRFFFFVLATLWMFSLAHTQEVIRHDGFEEYPVGTTDVAYWQEQTCATDPCAGCSVVPFIVSDEQARIGSHSVKMMKIGDDAALTGGNYCGYRTQFSNYQDAIFSYDQHAWIGFSVYLADHHLTDQWTQNNVWIFQFKNIDAGGGGNQSGSIKSYDRDRNGQFLYHVEGLGDIGPVALNTWTDFVIHINYRTDSQGLVEVWKNGEHFTKTGPLPAKLDCYLAFDIYGDEMAPNAPANKVYFDEIRFLKDGEDNDHYAKVIPGGVVSPVSAKHTEVEAIPGINVQQLVGMIIIEQEHSNRHPLNVFLFNSVGQLLITEKMNFKTTTLSTSQFPRGVYLLSLTDRRGKRYFKKLLLGF